LDKYQLSKEGETSLTTRRAGHGRRRISSLGTNLKLGGRGGGGRG